MGSLQARLLLTFALVGGALLATKTAIELPRAEAPVVTMAGVEARAALLETGAAVERSFTAGDRAGIDRVLRSLTARTGATEAVVADRQGRILFASPQSLAGRPVDATAMEPVWRVASRPGEGVRFEAEGAHFMAALPLRLERPAPAVLDGPPPPAVGPGAVLLRFDRTAAVAAARAQVLRLNAALGLVLLALMALAAVLVQVSVVEPARRIVRVIDRFDLGERSARVGPMQGELGPLARALDATAERLEAHENDLLESKNRFGRTLECLPVGVMVVRRDDGRPIYVNPRWKALFGIPMDATRDILSLLSTVRCERPDGSPYPLEQLPIPVTLRTGRPAEVRDIRVRRDDQVIALAAAAMPVNLWRDDTFDGVVAMVEEVGGSLVPEPAPEPEPEPYPSPSILDASAVEPIATVERQEHEVDAADSPLVLVVEGEESLRRVAESALTLAGYRVGVTGDGAEALAALRAEGPRVAAVVLDLWVPGPGGEALLDELLAIDPAARVIAASGYRADMPQLAASGKVAAFLPKPYGADRLIATVREVEEASFTGAQPSRAESSIGR